MTVIILYIIIQYCIIIEINLKNLPYKILSVFLVRGQKTKLFSHEQTLKIIYEKRKLLRNLKNKHKNDFEIKKSYNISGVHICFISYTRPYVYINKYLYQNLAHLNSF